MFNSESNSNLSEIGKYIKIIETQSTTDVNVDLTGYKEVCLCILNTISTDTSAVIQNSLRMPIDILYEIGNKQMVVQYTSSSAQSGILKLTSKTNGYIKLNSSGRSLILYGIK